MRGDYKSLIHRLNLLSRKPNLYIHRPHQQREHAEANYRKLIYELDNRGAQELRDRHLTIIERRTYQTHFGANTFMVAIITTNETCMNSMMALLERMNPAQSAKRFLFKHIPVFTSYKTSAPAMGHILTDPWKRAGFPDFYLKKE